MAYMRRGGQGGLWSLFSPEFLSVIISQVRKKVNIGSVPCIDARDRLVSWRLRFWLNHPAAMHCVESIGMGVHT